MIKILMLLAMLIMAGNAFAGTLQYTTEKGAIDGYDPVAYFSEGRAVRGTPQFTAQWNNATWRFTSAKHQAAFISDPEKYAPQYGGFCALGMAHGGDVPTDPTAWTIWQDKLYLNMISEVSITWRYNPDRLIERANRQWLNLNTVTK